MTSFQCPKSDELRKYISRVIHWWNRQRWIVCCLHNFQGGIHSLVGFSMVGRSVTHCQCKFALPQSSVRSNASRFHNSSARSFARARSLLLPSPLHSPLSYHRAQWVENGTARSQQPPASNRWGGRQAGGYSNQCDRQPPHTQLLPDNISRVSSAYFRSFSPRDTLVFLPAPLTQCASRNVHERH